MIILRAFFEWAHAPRQQWGIFVFLFTLFFLGCMSGVTYSWLYPNGFGSVPPVNVFLGGLWIMATVAATIVATYIIMFAVMLIQFWLSEE